MADAGTMARIESIIANWLVLHATKLFWIGLVLAITAMAGFSQIQLRNDYRAFFEVNDPVLERTDRLSSRMGDGRETAVLIYRPAEGHVLTSLGLLQYAEVADAAARLPHVIKAKSLFDAGKIVELPASDDTGRPRRALVPFVEGADLFTSLGLRVLAADIAATPTVNGRFIARDGSSATVVLQLDLDNGPGGRVDKLERLDMAVAGIERELTKAVPGDRLFLVGSTIFDYSSSKVLRADVRRLFPLALTLFLCTLLLLYRSWLFALVGLVLIVLPVAATGGLVAALGIEFSTLTVSALLLVGTLAVADVLHVANSFFLNMAKLGDAATALRAALAKNFWAITATSSTTAIGETALLFSASPPVRVMGITVIIGVVIAWALAVMMLPLVLLKIRVARPAGATWASGRLAAVSMACARRPWPVLAGFGALLLVATNGIALSRIDDSMSSWFSPRTAFRQGMDMLDAQYLGLRTMTLATLVTDADRAAQDSEAEALPVRKAQTALQDRLSAATPATWLSAVTAARAHAARLAAGKPTGLRPDPARLSPDPPPVTTRALSDAGLMTQYEPGRVDYQVGYFDPRGTTTFETLATAAKVEAAARMAVPERAPTVQGVGLAFAGLSARNFNSIAWGSVAAFAIMTGSLMLVFGSWRMGALSMVPNLAPLVLVYGLWGYWDGRINMAAVSVFSVACGIIVDDTIHLILVYRRNRRAGLDVTTAIGRAQDASGTGVLATTIVIAAGFFLLGLSDFILTAQKATMVGAAITIAFFFDLFAMPALLAVTERWQGHEGSAAIATETLVAAPSSERHR